MLGVGVRKLAVACGVAMVLAAPALAAGVGQWTQIVGGKQGSSEVISTVREQGRIVVGWAEHFASSDEIGLTAITNDGKTYAGAVVGGWTHASNPALVPDPFGYFGVRIFFAGEHTTKSSDPLVGMIMAAPTGSPGGNSWALTNIDSVTTDYGSGRVPAATLTSNGTPVVAWYDTSQPVVKLVTPQNHPNQPAVEFNQASGGHCCGIDENLATDTGTGRVLLAWCQFDQAANGIWIQQVNTSTGDPVGQPSRMPGSATLYNGKLSHVCETSQPTAEAARVGGGVYVASTGGYPSSSRVLVWRAGASSSATVASKSGQEFKVPQLAAAPDGRIWAGWLDSAGDVLLRRSNPSVTDWGATIRLRPPEGTVNGFELHLSAQANVVDVLARFGSAQAINVFLTTAQPGLTFSASPKSFSHKQRQTVHFLVLDAGSGVAGARVEVDGKSATTNGQGKASIELGPFTSPRTFKATAHAHGYTTATLHLHAT